MFMKIGKFRNPTSLVSQGNGLELSSSHTSFYFLYELSGA